MVLKLCCKSFLAFAESNYLVSCFTFVFLYLRFYINHCKSPVLKYTLTTLECIAILHNLLGSVTMYNSTLFCKRFRASFRCVLAKKSYCIFKNIKKCHLYKCAIFFKKEKNFGDGIGLYKISGSFSSVK